VAERKFSQWAGLRINVKMKNFNISQKAKKKVAYINNPLLTIYELVLRVL